MSADERVSLLRPVKQIGDRKIQGLHELPGYLLLGQCPRFGTGPTVGRRVVELTKLSQPLKVMVDAIVVGAHTTNMNRDHAAVNAEGERLKEQPGRWQRR